MSYDFEPPAIVAADFSSQNPEKVHCSSALARHLGLVTGVIMSDVWYWTSRNLARWDGWFYRSQEDWQQKTGLSEDSITRHLKRLEEMGYVESRRGKHPEAVSTKQWIKFYRATQSFNRMYSEILANEGFEDKTAKCGSENGRKPQNADLSREKTAKCGSENGRKPQNADLSRLESLSDGGSRPPQGSIDQGSIDQGKIPPTPQRGESERNRSETAIANLVLEPEAPEPLASQPDQKKDSSTQRGSGSGAESSAAAPPPKSSRKKKSGTVDWSGGRKPDFQAWIDTYMAHKPKKWASLRAIEGDVSLENCVKRVMVACSWDESEALRRMELALKYLKKHERPFWSEERHSFATMLRKETMHMMAWYESALDLNLGTDAEPSVPTAKRYEVADMPNPATYRQELAARINQAHARRA